MKYINKTHFFALFFSLLLIFTLGLSYANAISNHISSAVVRLHIVANSNTNEDQALKLKIRDRLVTETKHLFRDVSTPSQALSVAMDNIEIFQRIATDEARRQGSDAPITVSVGKAAFPTKHYSGITLPAGEYNAVKVRIGNAQGENWWCVMYPPLCFSEGVLSASESSKSKLKSNLSESEYKLITESSDSLPVEIRFKIVELFQHIF